MSTPIGRSHIWPAATTGEATCVACGLVVTPLTLDLASGPCLTPEDAGEDA